MCLRLTVTAYEAKEYVVGERTQGGEWVKQACAQEQDREREVYESITKVASFREGFSQPPN